MKVSSLYPTIVTENVEKALDFYAALGFSVKHTSKTTMGNRVYVVANDDLEIEISEALLNGAVPMPVGLYSFRMNVDDIDAAVEIIKQNGGTILAGPFEDEVKKVYCVKDADGIDITLMQHIKK